MEAFFLKLEVNKWPLKSVPLDIVIACQLSAS